MSEPSPINVPFIEPPIVSGGWQTLAFVVAPVRTDAFQESGLSCLDFAGTCLVTGLTKLTVSFLLYQSS